jgi:hypothetical protein
MSGRSLRAWTLVEMKYQKMINQIEKIAEENPASNNNLYVNSDYNSCNKSDEGDNNILQREEDIDQENRKRKS